MNIQKRWALAAIAILLTVTVISCAGTGDPMEDIVATRVQNVNPTVLANANPLDPDAEVVVVDVSAIGNPVLKDVVQKFFPGETRIAITERQFLKEEFQGDGVPTSEVVNLTVSVLIDPVTGEKKIDTGGLIQTVAGIATTIFPPIAPFLPLLPLLGFAKKRPRRHIANMVKAFVPTDGKIDVGATWMNAKRAVGWEHSSDDPAELERVAASLRVKKAVKNGELENLTKALNQ